MSESSGAPIPFNRPHYSDAAIDKLRQVLESGHASGDGAFTKRCQRYLGEVLDATVFLTTSCTDALEMSALLSDLQPGDEVIVPSFTFVTSAGAFVLRGAKPVFVDIRRDTLNIDESKIEAAITERTRAIVPVHYAGIACEMDTILEIAKRHDLQVVEDNAHGLFGKYKGRYLGTMGCLATQSFHETKNFSCGEGGALIVNDPGLRERAEIIREKGTNRSKFFRGEIDKYSWVDFGSSFLPSDLLAALLWSQLERRDQIQSRRRQIWEAYSEGLRDWAARHGVTLASIPEGIEASYHLFYLLLPSLAARTSLIAHLRARGIASVFHYLPLHISVMGTRFGGKAGDCPVTEEVSDRLLRLPFFNGMGDSDLSRVIEAVLSWKA